MNFCKLIFFLEQIYKGKTNKFIFIPTILRLDVDIAKVFSCQYSKTYLYLPCEIIESVFKCKISF